MSDFEPICWFVENNWPIILINWWVINNFLLVNYLIIDFVYNLVLVLATWDTQLFLCYILFKFGFFTREILRRRQMRASLFTILQVKRFVVTIFCNVISLHINHRDAGKNCILTMNIALVWHVCYYHKIISIQLNCKLCLKVKNHSPIFVCCKSKMFHLLRFTFHVQ